jgi:hypothetical protein
MDTGRQQPAQALYEIKQMMEKSSRFISLSGWSGVAAGVCALVAAFIVAGKAGCWKINTCFFRGVSPEQAATLEKELYIIAAGTFVAAFSSAFLFTWLRSKKTGVPVWGLVARRLMWSVTIPLLAGAIFLYRMVELGQYELVAPGCLVFYGLALVNASRHTLPEIRYLGYAELLLGFLNCWFTGYGLYFWAAGFGVLHIIYGVMMWLKYERKNA